jgi:hypothetical protein
VARLTRVVAVAAPLLVASLALSSCGVGGAVTDARASCVFVHRALALQARSDAPGISPGEQNRLQANALSELLKGTQPAADATSADGSWNPLETTINEAERVPMQNLVPALTRLCKVANSQSPYL